MKWPLEILLLVFNGALAGWHAILIAAGRPIRHFWWGLFYAAFATALYLAFPYRWWVVALLAVLIRVVAFAPLLNLYRHKSLLYINPHGESVLDRLEGKAYPYIYFGAWIILLYLNTQL